MADKLTPQQKQAVENRGGKLLVSAAAGSGKTKVLVDRLMLYLTDPVDPANLDEFLIITYTKAAASELRGKIAAKLTERIAEDPENRHLQKQMQRLFLTKISTVHGFCSDVLREYAYRLDLAADFRVADENECRELRETVLTDLLDNAYQSDNDPDFRAFVDTQGLGRTDALVPEVLQKVYDSAMCHLDPEGWLEDCLKASATEGITDAGQTVWGKYLLEDLFSWLDTQIVIFRKSVSMVEALPGLEKPAVNLKDTLYQLENLRNSETWDQVVQRKTVDFGRLVFPKKADVPEITEPVKAARNACKKGLEKKLRSFENDSRQILSDLSQCEEAARGLVQLVRKFGKEYARVKKSRRCVDFSDLEHRTLDLLLGKSRSTPTAAAAEIGSRFREILVDEYQDSNGVQDAIFSALTQKRQNLFLVGDVKQSIYQFRLADPGIFLQKYSTYLPAEEACPGEGRKVLLSHNFRSGGEVIEAVNHVFASCMSPQVGGLHYGEGEALREGIPHNVLPDRAVALYGIEVREDTYAEEAAFVAEQIHTMLREKTPVRSGDGFRPVTAEDIVILLRSPGSVGGDYKRALEARGIRCSSGGGVDLLKCQEIATFRSFLQTIANPRQDIPLLSTLASPVFGFTADDLAAFRSGHRAGSVYDALEKSDQPKAREFLEILKKLRREARMQTLTKLLETCLALTRMDSIFAAMEGGEAKKANLQTFYQLAADFEAGNHRDLLQFLDHLDAMEEKGLVTAGSAGSGSVTIMSIHKSKGLEFPVVFLSGLSREFNRESLRAQILCDKELGLGLSVADHDTRVRYSSLAKRAIAAKMSAESLSEEMRVLYVAMTRARDRLVMTYAAKNLQADLQDIALRLDFDGGAQLCRDAICPGDWVLIAAMQRTDAGAFHALAGRPAKTHMPKFAWNIEVTEAPELTVSGSAVTEGKQAMPDGTEEILREALAFRYEHVPATQAPSKQTATGRKGRAKDEEAAQDTQEPKHIHRSWRKPSFLAPGKSGVEYGSAVHAVMQHIRYENCGSLEGVVQEIQSMIRRGLLTREQGELVDASQIAAFFATEIGRKLRSGAEHLREFKFSILDDGTHYGDGLEGEQVLLQGVVDCALLEEDGITILDFKTDKVAEDTLEDAVKRYTLQVQTYAEALSRIYERTVKEKYLYFLRLNRFVRI